MYVRLRLRGVEDLTASIGMVEIASKPLDGAIVRVAHRIGTDDGDDSIRVETMIEVDPPAELETALRSLFSEPDTPFRVEPSALVDYGHDLFLRLHNACYQVFRLIRWRYNALSPDNALTTLDFSASFDQNEWRFIPLKLNFVAHGGTGLPLQRVDETAVGTMVAQGIDEPIGHQLRREAVKVGPAQRRSGLVIGLAAIESGFKQLVSETSARCRVATN